MVLKSTLKDLVPELMRIIVPDKETREELISTETNLNSSTPFP
jgi:hypothetical protein